MLCFEAMGWMTKAPVLKQPSDKFSEGEVFIRTQVGKIKNTIFLRGHGGKVEIEVWIS